jgi:hypothetical protein
LAAADLVAEVSAAEVVGLAVVAPVAAGSLLAYLVTRSF